MDWKAKAAEIVGARPAEFDPEWHEAKIKLIAGHLQRAYEEGIKATEEGVYEVVGWDELVDGKEMTHFDGDGGSRFEVKGPLQNVMVVVPDREALGAESRWDKVAETVLDSAKRTLKEAGWEGDIILVTPDIKLMRLKRRAF